MATNNLYENVFNCNVDTIEEYIEEHGMDFSMGVEVYKCADREYKRLSEEIRTYQVQLSWYPKVPIDKNYEDLSNAEKCTVYHLNNLKVLKTKMRTCEKIMKVIIDNRQIIPEKEVTNLIGSE